jgi:hypothetical protein
LITQGAVVPTITITKVELVKSKFLPGRAYEQIDGNTNSVTEMNLAVHLDDRVFILVATLYKKEHYSLPTGAGRGETKSHGNLLE